MAINKAYLTCGRTKESDECITPSYGVKPIVKHLKNKGYKAIWCPFDKKDSQYVRVLKAEGFNVENTHLAYGQDFFLTAPPHCDAIVSNPPFSIKDDILKRLYDLNKPFAVLLPQNSLQAIGRVNMYIKFGLEYLGFDRRICFYTNGDLSKIKMGNHFASGYFCKDVLPEKLLFEQLEPVQEPYI